MAAKFFFAAFAIPAMLCTASDTVSVLNTTNRIIGGVTAQKGDFPYAVSLQVSRGSRHFCTGSLLDPTTVLTAAHCVNLSEFGLDASDVVVRAGSLSSRSGGIIAEVSYMVPHPKFNDDTVAYDVGIVKLRKPLAAQNGISFARLAAAGFDPNVGRMATAAGWGDTHPGDRDGSRRLKEVDIPIVSRNACDALFRDLESDQTGDLYPDITEAMICAGYINDFDNSKDSCHGDSGGPLVDTDSGVVIGVVSWGSPECGGDGHIGVYARVGLARSFIDKNMAGSDKN